MSDFEHQLDHMIMYAPSGDLIRALAKRGALTRRLSGGKLKVTLKLDIEKRQPAPRRRRLVTGPEEDLVYGRVRRPAAATARSERE